MKIRALFLFLILIQSVGLAENSRLLRLSGQVSFRTDQLVQLQDDNLIIDPASEPSLKVQVVPLKRRGPASSGQRRVGSRETLKESSRIIIEAP